MIEKSIKYNDIWSKFKVGNVSHRNFMFSATALLARAGASKAKKALDFDPA